MNPEASDTPRRSRGSLRLQILLAGAVVLAVAAWARKDRGAEAPVEGGRNDSKLPTRLPPDEPSASDAEREAPAVAGGYQREIVRPKPVQNPAESVAPKDDSAIDPPPGGPASRRRDEKKTLPEIFRMPPDPAQPAPQAEQRPAAQAPERGATLQIADEFAPFGRLVKCQLVDTLDSVTARSEPIVGMVTRELDWNGQVIIPSGTEVFGYAKPDAVLDAAGVGRLVDTGEWTLVLPGGPDGDNGRELILKARAVDRREVVVTDTGLVRSWGLDDGADGLVGYTLSTLDNQEIRLFAAAAMSGLAQGVSAVAERQEPAPGVAGILGATQVAPTIGNALAGSLGTGAADAMNQVAGRIREEIAKRGVYVRVPAGKEFYLFVEQTIDPRAAEVGLRLPAERRQPR
jgi:hypothetical protein